MNVRGGIRATGVAGRPKALPYQVRDTLIKLVEMYIKVHIIV